MPVVRHHGARRCLDQIHPQPGQGLREKLIRHPPFRQKRVRNRLLSVALWGHRSVPAHGGAERHPRWAAHRRLGAIYPCWVHLTDDGTGGHVAEYESMPVEENTGRDVDGVVTKVSPWSVADTVTRLVSVVDARKMTMFAVIDHSREAKNEGLKLRDRKLVIFGSPRQEPR